MRFICLCLMAFAAWPAASADVLTGRVAGNVPKGSIWEQQWQHRIDVIKASPLADFEYYVYGELGSEEQVLGSLRRGRVQIASGSLWGLAALVPEAAVFSLPYLFESAAEADYVYDCCAAAILAPYLERQGYKFLGWSEAGWTNFYGQQAMATPDSVGGRKLRTPSTASVSVFFQRLGVDTVFIPINDVVPALQTGMVAGGASSLPWYFNAFKDQARHYTLTEHHYESTVLMANADWFAEATPAQQAMLIDAFGGFAEQRVMVRDDVAGKLDILRAEGYEVHALTTAQRQAWIDAAQATHAAILADIGGDAETIYAEILKAKAAYKARAD